MTLKKISVDKLVTHSNGKTMENFRNRIKVEFIQKDDNEKVFKQQSKLTFNGIHKSF